MGRAIDMEKDIDMLKAEVERLNNIVRGMSSSLNELEEKSIKTKHVDLVDDVKTKEEKKDGKKKANDEGSSGNNRTNTVSNRSNKKQSSKS